MLRVTQRRHVTTAFGTIGLFLMSAGGPAARQQSTPTPTPEHFTAFAINMGTAFGVPRTGQSQTVDIVIDRWSTQSERQSLMDAFLPKGDADKLLKALQKTRRVGYIRFPNTVGYDLHYAREVPGEDGGRRILIATDRRIGVREASEQPRTMDYPFTLIEMRLNKDSEGEGKMAVATKISLNKDKQQLELENYGSEPVRLNNIHKIK
jgi:hypothetical protein